MTEYLKIQPNLSFSRKSDEEIVKDFKNAESPSAFLNDKFGINNYYYDHEMCEVILSVMENEEDLVSISRINNFHEFLSLPPSVPMGEFYYFIKIVSMYSRYRDILKFSQPVKFSEIKSIQNSYEIKSATDEHPILLILLYNQTYNRLMSSNVYSIDAINGHNRMIISLLSLILSNTPEGLILKLYEVFCQNDELFFIENIYRFLRNEINQLIGKSVDYTKDTPPSWIASILFEDFSESFETKEEKKARREK